MSDTTTTTIPTGDLDDQAVTVPEPAAAGLDERLFEAAVGTLELLSIHLGRQLDLYRHLGQAGTAPELADRAGIDPRYAREWLEQQAVAGLIRTDATVTEWDNRPYWLDDEQRAVLVEAEDPAHVSPFAEMVVGIANAISDVEAAYRTGGGVPYTTYGKAFRDGQAAINRPAYASELADWVEAAPELADRLRSGGRIVDIGCGGGWSTIALARAFPEAEVVGIDADAASIDDAVANAAATAPDVDIRFELLDASDPIEEYGADLVLILEALHDMARPAEALEAARRILADGGAVLVADEKVSPTFVAPGDELERMMYGWSVSHCLPVAMAEEPSAAIGTVIRPSTVKALAREAGFASTELSDIDAGFFNLYVLRP